MALSLADRVRETTTTTGTGTVTLAGAVTGYQSFAVVGNGNATYYCIAGQDVSEWEVGIGTYTSSGTTLARTTVLSSSNSGSLVNFSAGIKDVFVTYPGERAVVTSVTSITSASTITPDSTYAQYEVTALAVPATIAAPSGTPIDGQKLILRIVDNGTARSLTWTTSAGAYRPRNVSLPAATVASNQMYVSCIYNAADNYWDVLLVSTGAGYTANGVVYANSTTSLTTGTALTFDGTVLTLTNGLIDLSSGYSIRWGGSASGIYAGSGTSDMVFTVGSSERLRINGTNGNVGIGTSSPSGKLDVQGAGGGVALQIKRDSSSVLQFYQGGGVNYIDAAAASSQFAFLINSSEKMRLDASGNLGIGTSSPAYKLHVVAASGIAAGFDRGDGSPAIIDLRTSGTTRGYLGATTSVPFIVYNSAPTELMRLDSSGNLGIGVTPSAWTFATGLQVQNAAIEGRSGTTSYATFSANGYTQAGVWKYISTDYASRYTQNQSAHYWYTAPSGTAGNTITFTQAMTLFASGGLALGTTTDPGAGNMIFSGTNSTIYGYQTSGNRSYIELYNALTGNMSLATTYPTAVISFLTGSTPTERARIDSSGNLGIGVTPSAWVASWKAIQGNSGGSFGVASGGNGMYVLSNAYYNTSGSPVYTSSSYASMYQQINGSHLFQIAASGTAGNAITFTQAMTLFASGGLAVGTTNDPGAGNITAANDFRLSANSYSRVADMDGGGGFGGGYNLLVDYTTAAPKYDSTGAISGYHYTSGGVVAFYAGSSASAGTTAPERARITSGGDLLVGVTTGSRHWLSKNNANEYAVTLNNSSANPLGVQIYHNTDSNGAGNQFLDCQGAANIRAQIRSNGGLANYQANNVDLSDARTKKDITPAASMWGKIGALEIVTYKYNDQTHDDVNLGVIAQQVEAVEPVWVDQDGFGETPEGEEPLKMVYTKDITFAAIKALQEAMARIEKLEAEVAALKGA